MQFGKQCNFTSDYILMVDMVIILVFLVYLCIELSMYI